MQYIKRMKHIAMNIKFEGQEHQIDANTLITALIHYQTVINESNKELSGGSKNIELKVNAFSKGSFVIDVSVVESFVKGIFSSDSISYLANLSAVVAGVYATYKAFKGRPIKTKDEEKAIAINIEDKRIIINKTIVNVYNQPVIREAISKTIESANEEPNVEGFSVGCDDGNISTTFKKEEFKDYIYTDFDKEENMPNEKVEEVDAILTIIALNFESGSRWQFIYNGFKIPMIVKDDALMKKIDEGERFGKGDAIKVKMRIMKRYNPQYKTYENKSYKIVEFYEHIVAPKQSDIF